MAAAAALERKGTVLHRKVNPKLLEQANSTAASHPPSVPKWKSRGAKCTENTAAQRRGRRTQASRTPALRAGRRTAAAPGAPRLRLCQASLVQQHIRHLLSWILTTPAWDSRVPTTVPDGCSVQAKPARCSSGYRSGSAPRRRRARKGTQSLMHLKQSLHTNGSHFPDCLCRSCSRRKPTAGGESPHPLTRNSASWESPDRTAWHQPLTGAATSHIAPRRGAHSSASLPSQPPQESHPHALPPLPPALTAHEAAALLPPALTAHGAAAPLLPQRSRPHSPHTGPRRRSSRAAPARTHRTRGRGAAPPAPLPPALTAHGAAAPLLPRRSRPHSPHTGPRRRSSRAAPARTHRTRGRGAARTWQGAGPDALSAHRAQPITALRPRPGPVTSRSGPAAERRLDDAQRGRAPASREAPPPVTQRLEPGQDGAGWGRTVRGAQRLALGGRRSADGARRTE
ncbi:uncharacterized protein DKFZp434B061-like [Pogoniulus pusillus]|uniref:uncharacterized protein DKFZp434B061-like n=1 Tax=Pogoniulus pusillus TaxID=488313 RepID=UPI0030B94255